MCGYLPDIGIPVDPSPMDFHAWFEVYIDGMWYTFDARPNVPRIGRVEIACGRERHSQPYIVIPNCRI